ncbi:dual specificity protein phosphatase [Verticillium alfalfae VaMs.102]|uniref:protein-tyrosine-phosphatase n=1 Tax=Verticillium alfalfae (strain VaMs.102 / ATCC MYA-4576 / FGSC 10136) TaxID=526221 RepID=C9SCC7_VERA1|nr:dual specificity protein phosphatase [Verticillium alfalfae VaMs.102]EEY16742.1 dual specificity protein phosphatase [Verticillium alfalfae VaMs.102]
MERLDHSTRADITDDIAGSLRRSCVEMALNRIDGDEELYVGGIFALKRPTALSDRGITHVLSVVRCNPSEDWSAQYRHKVIDVDDVDDEDLLYHLPGAKAVRNGRKAAVLADVIGVAAGGDATAPSDDEASDEQAEATEDPVFKAKADRLRAAASPSQNDAPALSADPRSADPDAITPLEDMLSHRLLREGGRGGRKHQIYQRWTYKREVEESLAVGEAPSRLRFEDEERAKGGASGPGTGQEKELRCKKCRRVLATSAFVLDHEPITGVSPASQACQHVFVEPLSWMRPTLEQAELEGRLICPSDKCGASLGRYSWRGFKCSCGGWVTPAFSLARGRVDEVRASVGMGAGTGADAEAARRAQRAALGIRMPAGAGGGNGRL